jgi:transposase
MTARHQLTPTTGVLVAIDVAKARNEVLIEVPGQARRRRLSVPNTRPEHDRLVALLAGLGQPVTCAFEATGNYHRPIAWRLLQAGLAVHLVSSLALARTREALHNSWDKNDPKDAQVILHMLRVGAVQRYHDPLATGINDVQELSKTHEAVSKAKTEVLHRLLTHYLPLYFPEIDRFRHNSRSDWFFAFLDRFPTPASITDARQGGVHRCRLGRGRSQGVEGASARRHLRDGPGLDRSAHPARCPGRPHVPPRGRRGAQPHPAA